MNPMNPQATYFTKGKVITLGRAIAICLSDAKLPGSSRDPHMTVLFRREPHWSADEVSSVSEKAKQWVTARFGADGSEIPFTLEQWGKRSAKVLGDLCELCEYLRESFAPLSSDEQRTPHVALFVGGGAFKKGHRSGSDVRRGESFEAKMRLRLQRKLSKTEYKLHKLEQLQRKRSEQAKRLAQRSSELREKLEQTSREQTASGDEEESIRNGSGSEERSRKHRCRRGRQYHHRRDRCHRRKGRKGERKERMRPDASQFVESLSIGKGENSSLRLLIDGYNVLGCVRECRRSMRRGFKGKRSARQRLAQLIDEAIERQSDATIGEAQLWFDGGNARRNSNRNQSFLSQSSLIRVCFSGNGQIVDDCVVEKLSKMQCQLDTTLVVTSDREFAARVQKCGAKVMKSGTFYRKYLKAFDAGKSSGESAELSFDDEQEEKENESFTPEELETTAEEGESFTVVQTGDFK